MDIDDEASLGQISSHVKVLVDEYHDLILKTIYQIQLNDAIITHRKLRRIKKDVLFKMLKRNCK